jgi:hypothetical protein
MIDPGPGRGVSSFTLHLTAGGPLQAPLRLEEFEAFLAEHEGRYGVRVSSLDGPFGVDAMAPSGRPSAEGLL